MNNYVKMLCDHFGVEQEEEFETESSKHYIYRISVDGFQYRYKGEDNWFVAGQPSIMRFWDEKVIRKPWKPKLDEYYFYNCNYGVSTRKCWTDSTFDLLNFAVGNCFHTKEEAEAFDLIGKLKEMGVDIDER